MIYLIDHNSDHAAFMTSVIKEHTATEVQLIELPLSPSTKQVYMTVASLYGKAKSSDIILCPWQITGHGQIDDLFEDLANQCWVIAAAGNSNAPIESITPARVHNVITVGCLNKSGVKATLSNYSTDSSKRLEWVTGTNYHIGNKTESGTSVAAALYAAFLSESLAAKDYSLLNKLIERQVQKVKLEILT